MMEFEQTIPTTANPTETRPALDRPDELEGATTIGRFVLLGTLGAGSMGVVYAAYDPELDRKIALKLLSPQAGGSSVSEGTTRLVREAQALAKLSHPNVVAVHDVGIHADRVWIAMEFVAGQTLTAWTAARPRRWFEVLPVLADVARGISAAHGAGLVHRDLKPDNVMLGRDGRVRVMDFGLAHGRSSTTIEPALASTLTDSTRGHPEFAALALQLTATGSLQGTPAYMAPEQWEGQEAEPATDQFGWSVMAWELLYGERPFAGETMMAIAAAVLSGKRRRPPRGSRVPGWLRRVIERGLAVQPARRWPTMAALLAALERGQTRARRRTAGVVLAGVALFGAGVEGYRRWDIAGRVAVCEAAGAEIDRAWDEDARLRLREAFTATGVSYAETTAEKLIPWLDAQAGAWKRGRTEVCLNADVEAVWGADLLDRALWCLEDRHVALTSLIAELGRANTTTVQTAVTAVAQQRTVDACLDADLLLRQPVPPAQGREVIREVRTLLSRARLLSFAGDEKAALTVATRARERAAEVHHWPRILAVARAQEGDLLGRTGAYEQAEAASTAAYFEAARVGAWDVAAGAAIDLIYIVGVERARYADGSAWAQHAEMALAHAADQEGLVEAGRLTNLASVLVNTGAFAEARALLERALTIHERALGLDHPDVAGSLNNLAQVLLSTGAYAEARALHERALAILERTLGPEHPDVATSLNNLAVANERLGAYAEARALHERALAIQVRDLGPEHPDVALSLNNLAAVLIGTGETVEARALCERALAVWERALGPNHPEVGLGLVNLARLHLSGETPRDALPLLERAMVLYDAHEGEQMGEAQAHFLLARALVATDGDRTRALEMARRALDEYREAGMATEVAEVEQFLAEQAAEARARPPLPRQR